VPGVGGAVAGALAGKRCVLTGVFPEVNTALLPFRSCASKAEKGPVSTGAAAWKVCFRAAACMYVAELAVLDISTMHCSDYEMQCVTRLVRRGSCLWHHVPPEIRSVDCPLKRRGMREDFM